MITATPLLSVKSVKKSFGEVKALKDINFNLHAGEIHALCGGNGAGKSTFMNVVMGFLQPDEGSISVKGQEMTFSSAKDALNAGITIVQQELSLIPNLTVAENIYLGQEPKKKFGFVDFNKMTLKATALLKELDFDINPNTLVYNLSVAEQQLIEIAKALSHSNAEIIFMDEPTSAIGEEESKKLLNVIRSLANKGKGIVYVSHRLSEIFEVASQYTVFRDGTYIADGKMKDVTREDIVELIIGGQINEEFSKFNIPQKEDLLEVRNFSCEKFRDINFSVKKGEILGIYGLVGSGRSEVLNAIFGIKVPTSGNVYLDGEKIDNTSPKLSISAGLAYVTEDRKNTGLVLSGSVAHNISISSLKNKSSYCFLDHSSEAKDVTSMIELFKIKTPNREQLVQNLSGGNQQKVVLGRWSLTNPSVLMLDEPTRGIDVGAKKEIYKYMSEQALEGKGIIMVSSELPEVIGMSDRVIVFKDGEIVDIVPKEKATQQLLLSLAS